jgi:hypothetical protein
MPKDLTSRLNILKTHTQGLFSNFQIMAFCINTLTVWPEELQVNWLLPIFAVLIRKATIMLVQSSYLNHYYHNPNPHPNHHYQK